MGKALDYRSLGHGLGVRHWATDHWVMVYGQGTGPHITGSWSRVKALDLWSWFSGKALDYRALGRGQGVRHWTTDHWVMV